jgi:GAF domain-containing protein
MEAEPGPTGSGHSAGPVADALLHDDIQRVLLAVGEQAGWPYAEAWVPRPDGTCQLVPVWYRGGGGLEPFRRPTEALQYMPSVGLPGRVVRSRQVLFVADVASDPLFCRRSAARRTGLVGAIGVPVFAGETVAAVLVFLGRAEQVPTWPRLVELALAAAGRLGLGTPPRPDRSGAPSAS